MSDHRHLIALFGATASGKTSVAADVARWLSVEVVSADSRQIRRGMQIGTAAPTDDELAAVPHHLIGIVEPDSPWTLTDWLDRTRVALEEIWSRNCIPLLLAGTGQYAWALLEGRVAPAVPPNEEFRRELEATVAAGGTEELHARLKRIDPASSERIDHRNPRRVIRALEIIDATGKPVPPPRVEPLDFSWTAVGLQWDRAQLYQRADQRAEEMYAAGLVDETRALVKRYGDQFDSLRSIGYVDALRVLDGSWSEAEALARTKTETHRLIRTQNSWFRAGDQRIDWVDATDREAVSAAIEGAATAPVR
jgi:tRNA dimethylallyltransferase